MKIILPLTSTEAWQKAYRPLSYTGGENSSEFISLPSPSAVKTPSEKVWPIWRESSQIWGKLGKPSESATKNYNASAATAQAERRSRRGDEAAVARLAPGLTTRDPGMNRKKSRRHGCGRAGAAAQCRSRSANSQPSPHVVAVALPRPPTHSFVRYRTILEQISWYSWTAWFDLCSKMMASSPSYRKVDVDFVKFTSCRVHAVLHAIIGVRRCANSWEA